MVKILKWIMHEFLNVLPAMVYFFIAFNIINITTDLLVEREGIKFTTVSTIAIGSLVVGKVLLIIDNLRFTNVFSDKPLVYNALWKTLIYSSAGLIYRFVEKLVPFISTYKKPALAYQRFIIEMDWPRFWAVQIWVILLFFSFAIIREFIYELGQERVRQMFFGR